MYCNVISKVIFYLHYLFKDIKIALSNLCYCPFILHFCLVLSQTLLPKMEPQVFKRTPIFKKSTTLFQYNLTSKQNIYTHYILPTSLSLVIYILHLSSDLVLSYQHYKTENPFYASFTLFLIFVPAISSFFLTVINLNLWPDEETCGSRSIKWFFIRFFQHLFFPIWAMYR